MRGDADEWWAYAKEEKDTAAVLMAAARWRACYHHAGQSLEFALKALYLRRNSLALMSEQARGAKWHQLEVIAEHAKLEVEIGGLKTDRIRYANWLTARDWNSNARFPGAKTSKAEALDLMSAAFNPSKGIFPWLEKIYLRS
jgi:HEPN domain-containing protein